MPKTLELNKLNVKMSDLQNKIEKFQKLFTNIDPKDFNNYEEINEIYQNNNK